MVNILSLAAEVTEPRAPPSLWPHWLDQGDLLEGQGWWAKAKVMVWGPQPEPATSTTYFKLRRATFQNLEPQHETPDFQL